MIRGIGTDLLEIPRMRASLERFGDRLPRRILHPAEWPRFERENDRARWLAKCFAAKEATAKALGLGFHGIAPHDIGLDAGALRRPVLVFSAAGERVLVRAGVGARHVSITDQSELVMAFVVLEMCPDQSML